MGIYHKKTVSHGMIGHIEIENSTKLMKVQISVEKRKGGTFQPSSRKRTNLAPPQKEKWDGFDSNV